MANYATAVLTKYQAKILGLFNAGELRVREPKVFNSLRKGTEIMIPSHSQIKNAAKRTTGEVNFFGRAARSLGTGGEIYNHTGVKADSAVIVPAWTAYDDKFTYSLKQANGSVYALDEMLMNEMVNLNNNFSEGLESAAATWINTNRSGVNVSTIEGTFNGTNDAFEITEAFTNVTSAGYRVAQIIESTMEINKWTGGRYTAYCDSLMYNKMQALAANGSGNNVNSSFQFGNIEFIRSPELNAASATLLYTKGYAIVVQEMNTAVLDWMPEQNRNGDMGVDNKYGSIIHPTTGLPIAWHEYSARADGSGTGSENQDVKTEVQAFTYISLNASPLTTADETPLYAFAIV